MANEDQDTVQYEDWEMVNLIDRHDKSKCVLLVSLTSSWQNCNLTKDFTFIFLSGLLRRLSWNSSTSLTRIPDVHF